ncbi:MAG: glutamate--tRNA ligase family protein [Campylobacterota bacterium]|nr:glutamate--tRNA ligase family protein [Campylobacterota bacterium]
MLRFASSPTADISISDLRVALINSIVSVQKQEELIVRIEDMDKEKNIENKDQEILDTLSLFDITYSQVTYQSQNVRFYSAMALQLVHEKKAFSCFCSDNWIEKKREEAKQEGKAYSYDDACRNLPAELVIDNTNPFSIRVARPDNALIVKDIVQGDISFEPDEIDSFVILDQNKTPMYDFATAVDDMLNNVSGVIVNDDKINNSSKQKYIRDSLKYEKQLEYAHIPPINSSLSVKELLREGYLPEAISNYLISTLYEMPNRIFTIKTAAEWFDLSCITKSPARLDINALKDINQQHLKDLDAKELSRYVGFADSEIGELARIYLEEATTTQELKVKISPIFSQRNIPDALQEKISLMTETIKSAPYFDEYDDFKQHVMKHSGLEDESFSKPLRILLTNAEDGPELAEIYKYLKNYIGEIIK